jgi:hypothetical protein
MARSRTPVAALVLAVLASGCAARMDHARRYSGPKTLRVVNATAKPICELYVAQRDEHLWGHNWIDGTIAPGGHVDVAVRPDDYMIRASCDRFTALVAYRVAVDGDLELVIHDGYPPARSDDGFADRIELPSWTKRYTHMPKRAVSGVELEVHNRCARDLRVVLGGDPLLRSGTPSTLPAHAVLVYSAPAGTPLWLVDEAYRPIASTPLANAGDVEITPTCDAFTTS